MQTISCSVGTLEVKPESTKFSMQNISKVQLLGVKWNGTDFGDIDIGELSERMVMDGNDYVYFNTSNGKQYRTFAPIDGKKYMRNKLTFMDNYPVIDLATNSQGTLGGAH